MTKTTAPETLHFLATGLSYLRTDHGPALGVVSTRGEELVLTPQVIDANSDRNGTCVFDLLHNPEAQVARFGREFFAPGPAPADMLRTEPGTAEHEVARARERHAASHLADPKDRADALREIAERYGEPPTSSRTLSTYGEAS